MKKRQNQEEKEREYNTVFRIMVISKWRGQGIGSGTLHAVSNLWEYTGIHYVVFIPNTFYKDSFIIPQYLLKQQQQTRRLSNIPILPLKKGFSSLPRTG